MTTTINQLDKNGERTGLWQDHYSNGKLYNIGKYKNGERTGLWKYYYRSGKLKK